MPISAGLREDIAVYRGFIGQQYLLNKAMQKSKDIEGRAEKLVCQSEKLLSFH